MSNTISLTGTPANDNPPATLKRYAIALVIVALVQSAVLAMMVMDRVSLLNNGREITLDTIPVDPRSLFRGDYVILNYEISTLDTAMLEGEDTFKRNATIYVTLARDEAGKWQPKSLHSKMPETSSQQEIILRGRTRYPGKKIQVRYGIESYFVPEGAGKRLEKLVSDKKIAIQVAVSSEGEAAVKGLLIDGVLQYEEPLF